MAGVIIFPVPAVSGGWQQPTTVQTGVTAELTSGSGGGFGAWVQLIASTAAAMKHAQFTGAFRPTSNEGGRVRVEIGSGGAGVEVVIGEAELEITRTSDVGFQGMFWKIDLYKTLATGTRLAIRALFDGATGVTYTCGYTLEET